jgi:hypothetical protein
MAETCCNSDVTTVPSHHPGRHKWVCGEIRTSAGTVLQVTPVWSRKDWWGAIQSRISAFRMHYSLEPGLYAIGEPSASSEVFVSANYKLSFDHLRRSLKGRNAWLLVLDTGGINVWCAAGKGTFGTNELVRRIREVRLDQVVQHRKIIVPQLGAPGLQAHLVKAETGFRVDFGPVYAKDLKAYVDAGHQATREMRTVRFSFLDRLILTPMELNPILKRYPYYLVGVLLFFGLQPRGVLFRPAWTAGYPFLVMGLVAVFAGAFLTPILLPYVPSPSFGWKGWIVGVVSLFVVLPFGFLPAQSKLLLLTSFLFFPVASSYFALNFTGSTTFTSMSGVERELKRALPFYIGTVVLSVVLLIVFKAREWGLL